VEIARAISEVMNFELTNEHVSLLLSEFDKDGNGEIDMAEFVMMVVCTLMIKHVLNCILMSTCSLQSHCHQISPNQRYMEDNVEPNLDFSDQMAKAVAVSRLETAKLLSEVSTNIYPFRNILCVQGKLTPDLDNPPHYDDDFEPAFAPSEMRCLALVSHNGMKATMKEFVTMNKNILKKFRLTGAQSTMKMLSEVFKGDSSVVFGPSCTSGPLGGDAELVALMCSGRLGGILFFEDPLSAHAHQADIHCLCRQAQVHNTMICATTTSALMMMHVLRSALQGNGRPELIPSFFFSLKSPAVVAYLGEQEKVIATHSSG
jgi:methylglyoxal synthase